MLYVVKIYIVYTIPDGIKFQIFNYSFRIREKKKLYHRAL